MPSAGIGGILHKKSAFLQAGLAEMVQLVQHITIPRIGEAEYPHKWGAGANLVYDKPFSSESEFRVQSGFMWTQITPRGGFSGIGAIRG
jgi:hypothetical protein